MLLYRYLRAVQSVKNSIQSRKPKGEEACPRPRRGGPSCLGQTAPVPSPLVPYNTVVEDWDEVLEVALP